MGDAAGGSPAPCLGSGMCCKKSACAFGHWDVQAHKCKHLVVAMGGESVTIYRCGIHDQISKHPEAVWNPAFGAGCCMPLFNTDRQSIVRVLADRDSPHHRQAVEVLGLGRA